MEGAESFLRSSISVVEDIFMAESYGLSKSEYRKYIDDPTVSAKMLSKKLLNQNVFIDTGGWGMKIMVLG